MPCRRVKNFIVFVAAAVFCSCSTVKFEDSATLVGNVCDEQGRPVSDCRISLDFFRRTCTDASGIFVFRDVKAGDYRIRGQKDKYSKFSEKVKFYDRRKFFHFEMPDFSKISAKKEKGKKDE